MDRPLKRRGTILRRPQAIRVGPCRAVNEMIPTSMIQPYGPTRLWPKPFRCRTAGRETRRSRKPVSCASPPTKRGFSSPSEAGRQKHNEFLQADPCSTGTEGETVAVNKVNWSQVGRVTEPGRYMFKFGWLTITEAELAVWQQFPQASFTLYRPSQPRPRMIFASAHSNCPTIPSGNAALDCSFDVFSSREPPSTHGSSPRHASLENAMGRDQATATMSSGAASSGNSLSRPAVYCCSPACSLELLASRFLASSSPYRNARNA